MQIEIVRWVGEREQRHEFILPEGSTVADALRESRLDTVAEDWLRQSGAIGLGGHLAALDQMLKDGDRIEFLRPLEAGARELRRKRVRRARRMGRSPQPSGQNLLTVADDANDPAVVKNDLEPNDACAREMAGLPIEEVMPVRS